MSSRANPLRNLLLKLQWSPNVNADDYAISFTSRGSRSGVETVRGSAIERVYLRGFEVRVGEKVIYVPFHRVVMVENQATGEIIYRKITNT